VPGLADEGLAQWVAQVRRSGGPPSRALGAHRLREAARQRAAARSRGPEMALVRDVRTDDGLPLRLYRPAREPRPLVIYLHGGGFVVGDLDSHDGICRRLARTADVAVLAVAYRLAPEYPAPAAVDDAVSAFTWAQPRLGDLGGDPAYGCGLAGDSSGGALAVLAAVRLGGQPGTVSSLLLACPNADMTLSQPSVEGEGHGWGLDAGDLRWFVEQWIPDPRDRNNPAVSPVHADLGGLPPAVVATAGHDPLRDEGGMLARLMREAGADVTYVPHPGLVHGFVGLADVSPAARRAGEDLFRRYGTVAHRLAGARPWPRGSGTGAARDLVRPQLAAHPDGRGRLTTASFGSGSVPVPESR
jgi:acetyl esterase